MSAPIKSIMVRHPADEKPIVTDVVSSLIENPPFTVKIVHVKKGQEEIEASFVPSGCVSLL